MKSTRFSPHALQMRKYTPRSRACKTPQRWYNRLMACGRRNDSGIDRAIGLYESGGEKLRLLLHVCCGPCAAGVLPRVAPAFDVTLFFYNPNILPKEEFIKRLDTFKTAFESFS